MSGAKPQPSRAIVQQRTSGGEDRDTAHTPESQPKARVTLPQLSRKWILVSLVAVVVGAGAVIGYVYRDDWIGPANRLWAPLHDDGQAESEHAADAPADDNHRDAVAANSLELSEQGQKNVGLRLATIELQDFDRTINVPAMVTERPGRTRITVATPMTGVVTRIYPIRGEAVMPGQPLFDLRLTHQDLVETQSAFLETLEKLDVTKREVARLETVTSSGAVAGKRLLEREYEQQQAEASLRAQQQAMILHGLTVEQVDQIKATRQLIQQITIQAPGPVDASTYDADEHLLQVSSIAVGPGQHVEAGDVLGVLSDHCELYIEGRAFEEDAGELNDVANRAVPVTAVIESSGKDLHSVQDLKILYVENEVELDSRALRFYVRLPNELVRNEMTQDGHRFVGWRFKPGQRVKLHVPVERWPDRIVLPVDAVVKEGPDWFVFQQNGTVFDRKPVHVEYRDSRWAVIESDGTLFPGDVVAVSGAYQMQLALKNKAGGGVDPHAGHNH